MRNVSESVGWIFMRREEVPRLKRIRGVAFSEKRKKEKKKKKAKESIIIRRK